MSEARLQQSGIKPTSTAGRLQTRVVDAGVDRRTGEIRQSKLTGFYLDGVEGKKMWVGPDVGFNSSPAASHLIDDVLVQRAREISDSKTALAQAQRAVTSPARMEAWQSFVQNTLEFGRQQGQSMTVGIMQAEEFAYAVAHGAKLDSPVIFVQDRLLQSPKAKRHQADGDALVLDDWLVLPKLFEQAQSVAWDVKEKTVVYLIPGAIGKTSRLAVRFGRMKNSGLNLPDAATIFQTTEMQFNDYLEQGRYVKIR